jgi:hypothetical protein
VADKSQMGRKIRHQLWTSATRPKRLVWVADGGGEACTSALNRPAGPDLRSASLFARAQFSHYIRGGSPERVDRTSSNPNTTPAHVIQAIASLEALMREPNALISTEALARELDGSNLRVFDCTS